MDDKFVNSIATPQGILDIPEFLKGQTKEYVRIEKHEYQEIIAGFNQTRHLAFIRGIIVGAFLVLALLSLILLIYVTYFQTHMLPMAGP